MRKIIFSLAIGLMALTIVGAGCAFGGAKTTDTSKAGGVYKSTDSGASWSQSSVYPLTKVIGSIGAAEIRVLVIDPQDHEAIYAGTDSNGFVFSYDRGETWRSPEADELKTGEIVSLAVDPFNLCVIYAATNSRLLKTDNCGRTAESVYDESREKTSVRRVAVDWYNQDTLYLGLSNGDVLKSVNAGDSWTKIGNFDQAITSFLVSSQDSRVLLVGTAEGLWKTADGGASWTQLEDQLKSFKKADEIYLLAQDKTGGTILAVSKYGLLRSTDLGESWGALNLLTSAGQVKISALALDPSNPNVIYYSTETTFYKSTDGGVNWDTQKLSGGWGASALAVDPEETNIIFLGREKIKD